MYDSHNPKSPSNSKAEYTEQLAASDTSRDSEMYVVVYDVTASAGV